MKITFLGTGAADWKRAKHQHMEGFRRNSSILIDDCLLIDPGPDVPDAMEAFGKNPESVRYLLNTHRHSDHYCGETVSYLSRAELIGMKEGEERVVGPYTVTAFRANHATCEEAVHFMIYDGSVRMFYGMDGAWLLYEEARAIREMGVDLAILDATVGEIRGDYRVFEHNDLHMVRGIKASLEPYAKRWMISHMARTLHTSHGELAERMRADGIEVAFDGLEIEI